MPSGNVVWNYTKSRYAGCHDAEFYKTEYNYTDCCNSDVIMLIVTTSECHYDACHNAKLSLR
jgi:hypothetical protein